MRYGNAEKCTPFPCSTQTTREMSKVDSEVRKNPRFIGLAQRAVRRALLALVRSDVLILTSAL
jgi:hypothetical protein